MADLQRMRLIAAIFGMLAGALLLTAARAQTLIESAQKESEVVVYGANLNDTMDPMHRAFEKKF